MIFKTNRGNSLSSNLEPNIIDFEICLMQWCPRKLTLIGKCCNKIICTPKTHISFNIIAKSAKGNFQTYRKKQMYVFIWDGKPDKIKREILNLIMTTGGLESLI